MSRPILQVSSSRDTGKPLPPYSFAASLMSSGHRTTRLCGRGFHPRTPFHRNGSPFLELGTPYVCRSARCARSYGVPSQNQPSSSECKIWVPLCGTPTRSQTWARKGSMEQSVHRPLSQSGLRFGRRVNSAAGERVGLDLLRRPRRPVVTARCIDPPTPSLRNGDLWRTR